MIRAILLALLILTARGAEQAGSLDAAFDKIPFDQWMASGAQGRFRWTAHGSHPELSFHQRLVARVELQLDGADLVTRRGNGQLVFFVQLTDAAGRRYQNHGSIDLGKLEDGLRSQYLTYTQPAFVLPGDYHVAVAVLETATEEHSVRQFDLHVPPLKNDPLPNAWRDLPPVEFVQSVEPPDSWFQPGSSSRLYLPVVPKRPIRPEIMVNLTPSEAPTGTRAIPHRNLNALMPSLKVVSELEYPAAPLPLALLDVSRRRMVFRQANARRPDWAGISSALSETNPGTIDVKSLEARHQNAAFFVREVRKRLDAELPAGAEGAVRVLIILSAPVEFESGEDLEPIHLEQPVDYRVFYFRFQSPTVMRMPGMPPAGTGRRTRSSRPMYSGPSQPVDQLAGTLKSLSPRIVDIETADQFRKALARMLEEISGL